MAKQNKAQREYMRDVRIHNSINYSARSTMPRKLQNIDIIRKTMRYNELGDEPNSFEANKVKVINTGLLMFTIVFEVLAATMQIMAFAMALGGGRARRRSRRRW